MNRPIGVKIIGEDRDQRITFLRLLAAGADLVSKGRDGRDTIIRLTEAQLSDLREALK